MSPRPSTTGLIWENLGDKHEQSAFFKQRKGAEMSAEGRALAEAGMQMALFAKPEWKLRAEATILELAQSGKPFTADDVTERVGLPTSYKGMNANNAVGAAISAAARRKQIMPIGYTTANRVSSHSRVLRIWRGVNVV